MKKKILFLLLTGFLLRILAWWLLPSVLADDAGKYQQIAVHLVKEGKFYNDEGLAYRPPLQSLFIAGVYKIFGVNNFWVSLIQIIISLLTVYLIYRIAESCLGEAKKWVIVLGIFSFDLALFAPLLMSETMFTFFLVLGLWLFAVFLKTEKLTYLILFPLFWGISALAKPTLILVFLTLVVYLIFKKIIKPSSFFLAVMLILLPSLIWSFRNYLIFGRPVFVSTNSGLNFYIGNNPYSLGTYDKNTEKILFLFDDKSEVERNALYLKEAKNFIIKNPGRALLNILRKPFYIFPAFGGSAEGLVIRQFQLGNFELKNILRGLFGLGQIVSYWIILYFGLYFAIFYFKKIRKSLILSSLLSSLLIISLGYVLFLLPFFTFPRFRIPLLFPLIIFAGLGAEDFFKNRDWRKTLKIFPIFFLLTIRDWVKIGKAMFTIFKDFLFWQPKDFGFNQILFFFSHWFLWLMIFGLAAWFIYKKNWKKLFYFLVILAISEVIEIIGKHFSPWPRPFQTNGIIPPNWLFGYSVGSFPSGHGLRFSIIFYLLYKENKQVCFWRNKKIFWRNKKIFWILLGGGIAALAGRILFGLHYPVDIIGGVVIGYVLVKLINPQKIKILNNFKLKIKN